MHAAYTGGTTVLNAVTGGADLKTIATLTNKLDYDVMAGPNIKTAKDLRGLSSLDTELGDDASPAILSFPRTRESSIIVTPVQTGVHPTVQPGYRFSTV